MPCDIEFEKAYVSCEYADTNGLAMELEMLIRRVNLTNTKFFLAFFSLIFVAGPVAAAVIQCPELKADFKLEKPWFSKAKVLIKWHKQNFWKDHNGIEIHGGEYTNFCEIEGASQICTSIHSSRPPISQVLDFELKKLTYIEGGSISRVEHCYSWKD